MAQFELEQSQRRHPTAKPLEAVDDGDASLRQWLGEIRSELDKYYEMGNHWANTEPDVVMAEISAIMARLTEIRAHLCRKSSQRANRLRLDEIDPLLDRLNDQFKIHSRLVAVRQLDWDVVRGAET